MTSLYSRLFNNLNNVIQGKTTAIRHLLAAFACGGHVLLEDLPGTGKTTLAKALAASCAMDFQRIQFTPDLLPSDILGVSIFDPKKQGFNFHAGPVFTDILLADEINRASPRTQSALLEAMGESQISLDGKQYPLSPHFFVIATQNPVEFHGTYPLPEAQMDRFALSFSLGYVPLATEVAILVSQQHKPLQQLTTCVTPAEWQSLKTEGQKIHISEELLFYIVRLVQATRQHAGVCVGASPRASLALMQLAKALALFDGLNYVTPDHIQEIAVACIAHRLKLDSHSRFSGAENHAIMHDILRQTKVPR
jgi:MoxR-like ATPase